MQRPAKVSRGSLQKVIQVTFQLLVCDFSHRYLQFELADDPKKIVVNAKLECDLDTKVWLPVHIPFTSSNLRCSNCIHMIENEYVFNSILEELSHSHKSKLLQLGRHVCISSVFHRLVIDQYTGQKSATSKHKSEVIHLTYLYLNRNTCTVSSVCFD
jgi:hypothetical protein